MINQDVHVCMLSGFSCAPLCVMLWTVAREAPLSMAFSRQEHWRALPFPPPGDLPDPEIEPRSPVFQADALTFEPPGKPITRFTVPQTMLQRTSLSLCIRALGWVSVS